MEMFGRRKAQSNPCVMNTILFGPGS
jgi:hypothetical protein